jgi:hypothetical protein
MNIIRLTVIAILLNLMLFTSISAAASSKETKHINVPQYILNGLDEYETNGYEAAVKAWFKGSPYQKADVLVARINYLKNIEMLYGKYQGYKIITVKETPTSNFTYVEFIYERLSGFASFMSFKYSNAWALSDVDLHKNQRFADTP